MSEPRRITITISAEMLAEVFKRPEDLTRGVRPIGPFLPDDAVLVGISQAGFEEQWVFAFEAQGEGTQIATKEELQPSFEWLAPPGADEVLKSFNLGLEQGGQSYRKAMEIVEAQAGALRRIRNKCKAERRKAGGR